MMKSLQRQEDDRKQRNYYKMPEILSDSDSHMAGAYDPT